MYKTPSQVYNFYDYVDFVTKVKKSLVRANVTIYRARPKYIPLLASHVKASQAETLRSLCISPFIPSAPPPTPVLPPRAIFVLPPPLQAFNAQQKLLQNKRKIIKTKLNNGKETFFDSNSKVVLPIFNYNRNINEERITNRSQRIEPLKRIQPQQKRPIPTKLIYSSRNI